MLLQRIAAQLLLLTLAGRRALLGPGVAGDHTGRASRARQIDQRQLAAGAPADARSRTVGPGGADTDRQDSVATMRAHESVWQAWAGTDVPATQGVADYLDELGPCAYRQTRPSPIGRAAGRLAQFDGASLCE